VFVMPGSLMNADDYFRISLTASDEMNLASRKSQWPLGRGFERFYGFLGGETNQWNPNADRDPGRDTYASPDVFSNYADFYARAARASKIAYNASRAKQDGDFKKFVVELRVACDSCHAVYLKADR